MGSDECLLDTFSYDAAQITCSIGSISIVVLFLHYNTMQCIAMPRTLYITVLPYYIYSLKIHTMHDIRKNTQGHVSHSLAASQGLES